MRRSTAKIVREYGPLTGIDHVHGVTYDGQHVWFAAGDTLNALDPASGKTLRSIDVAAHAGAAFDSELRRVDRRTGQVLETLELPPGVAVSGLESDGTGAFFCGGGRSGTVRAVRGPKRVR